MFTGIASQGAFIDILITDSPPVSKGTTTKEAALEGVGFTRGSFVTGVTNTCVIHLTEDPSFANRALAHKRCNSVMAGGPMHAGSTSTVIYVFTAVITTPSVDTDAVVTSDVIGAGPSILTCIWLQLTLIHIFCTKLTCPFRSAPAVVRVHSIHTGTSILAIMLGAVINVYLAILPTESWQAVAFIGQVIVGWSAGAPIHTWRWCAGDIYTLAAGPRESCFTQAVVRARNVVARPSIPAQTPGVAFIDVGLAAGSGVARSAATGVVVS